MEAIPDIFLDVLPQKYVTCEEYRYRSVAQVPILNDVENDVFFMLYVN